LMLCQPSLFGLVYLYMPHMVITHCLDGATHLSSVHLAAFAQAVVQTWDLSRRPSFSVHWRIEGLVTSNTDCEHWLTQDRVGCGDVSWLAEDRLVCDVKNWLWIEWRCELTQDRVGCENVNWLQID
jgi:hypothetical protein